ncbi:MAG: cellulase family glycosylhydrolase [Acetobacteraceae bacterium]
MSGTTSATQPAGTGRFHVVNGTIVDPNGNPFYAVGINVFDFQLGDAEEILATLPGLNFVRVPVYTYQAPAAYEAFIATMTANGVVVELENHTDTTGGHHGGGYGVAFTGELLAAESAWYASVAKAFADNPYVWFGTNNEPPQVGLSAWHQTTYDAIRGAGNENPILVAYPGGGWPGLDFRGYGLDPAVYAKMTNIIGDIHLYGWSSKFVPDQTVVNAALADLVHNAQTIQSADGKLPILIGEFGPSTDGVTDDANRAEVVNAIRSSGDIVGAAAFAWHAGVNDNITDADGKLTWFGEQVAQWAATFQAPGGPSAAAHVAPDTLSIVLSGDSYEGNPAFIATLDGQTLTAGPTPVTAANGSATQAFDFSGAWDLGGHTLEISFVNDLHGGNELMDRNLYVEQVVWKGVGMLNTTQALYSDDTVVIQLP